MNKFNSIKQNIGLFLLVFSVGYFAFSQDMKLISGKKYIIGGVDVIGASEYSKETVIAYTGLTVGQAIKVPGEKISGVITKLWQLGLFSDVNIYASKIDGETIFLTIKIQELPALNNYKIYGVTKSKKKRI